MKGKELNPDASIEEFSRLNKSEAGHTGLRQKKLVLRNGSYLQSDR
jgi:hypothetical protein